MRNGVGAIVVLNGPSSAGKTTLARAVRDTLGPSVAAVSIDPFFAFLHRDAKVGWTMYSALTDAVFSSAVALARGGGDVIVDTVFERQECLHAAERALRGHVR